MAAARRSGIGSPALVASALIHVALIAAALISWPWMSKPMILGKVVPVTIVTNGPPADLAAAVQADEPAPAQAETPVEDAPPEPAPITPAPPTPPAAASPKQAAATQPTKAAPSPALKPKASTTPSKTAKPDFDLDALMSSIASSTKRPSANQASGDRGPNRQRTDTTARQGKGEDDHLSASEIDALRSKLEKLWNPNCQVEGAAGVNVKIRIRLTPDGRLAGQPELQDRGDIQSSGDPILIASALRALSAVGRGAPYTELNPDHYQTWREMVVTFNAKQACAR